jgi:eukaryotic-like serine/threonine-protein kinase
MNSNLINKILNRKYLITAILNDTSGQGTIYLAKDTTRSLNNDCVIKQFKQNYDNEFQLQIAKRLFEQEAKVLQKLGKHSQIPQIFDYFEVEGQFFLVQELIEGENFQQELARKQTLTETETKGLLIDVLNVLNFVHQNHYIHRDIKPSNLIRNKFDHKIFLIDFGAVKEKLNPQNIDGLGEFTQTIPIHTPGYAPIEQIRGTPKFCSDIYALGMVAIQALTGIYPKQLEYDQNNNPIWQHLLPINSFNSHFLSLINQMVLDNARDRYQSVQQVLDDLINLPKEIIPEIATETQEKQKSFQKAKILRLSSLGIATIGIISSLFFWLKSTRYSSYKSSEYGITIEYPKTWTQEEETDFLCSGIIFNSPYEKQSDKFRERVKVCVENLAKPLTLQEYSNRFIAEIKQNNSFIEYPKSTTLANKEGIRVVYQGTDGKQRMEAWTVKNQKAYLITYTAEQDKYNQFLDEAEKMFQSLQIMSADALP